MKTVVEEFYHLWPSQGRTVLIDLIANVQFLYFPEDMLSLRSLRDPFNYVVIMNSGQVKDAVDLVSKGFEHVVQRNRPDFAQELLTSALMIARPKAFLNNPIPFILTGAPSPTSEDGQDNELILKFQTTSDRPIVLSALEVFIKKNEKLVGIYDLCIQAADELISNALFHAPVNFKGEHIHQHLQRTTKVQVPENKASRLFIRFSDYRVVIGCEDQYGSLNKRFILDHLAGILAPELVKPRSALSPSAGIGMRFMIENSANFYMYCDRGKRSLVACGFLTAGLKSNLTSAKHLHFSFK